jgi:hypothetical protein
MGWFSWGKKQVPKSEAAPAPMRQEQEKAAAEQAAEQKRRAVELNAQRDAQRDQRQQEMREQIMDTTGRKLYLRDRLQKLVPSKEWDEMAVSKVMTDEEIMQLPKMGNDELALRRMADAIAERVIKDSIDQRDAENIRPTGT